MSDKSIIARRLKPTCQTIVDRASRSGELADGTFTMGIARRRVCAAMGLEEGALDGEWKGKVKEGVQSALVRESAFLLICNPC
jgi:hypothetical protein